VEVERWKGTEHLTLLRSTTKRASSEKNRKRGIGEVSETGKGRILR